MTEPKQPTWLQALQSVLAAMFGVQTAKNRQRDFSSVSPWKFVVMGLVMTAVFILSIVLIVQMVLPVN